MDLKRVFNCDTVSKLFIEMGANWCCVTEGLRGGAIYISMDGVVIDALTILIFSTKKSKNCLESMLKEGAVEGVTFKRQKEL